jgi:uncharacterized protein
MEIPSVDQIRALHERYAPTRAAFDLVYTHCQIVRDVADQLLARWAAPVDADLVRAGALLHDLGVYKLFGPDGVLDHAGYIRHGVLGHEILRAEGLPEQICRFCSCHTGVGLSRDDIVRQHLPLPPADYLAGSVEEELVMYADKFHSKSTPPTFVSAETYTAKVARFGREKAERFTAMRTKFGEPDLAPLAAAHGHSVVSTHR